MSRKLMFCPQCRIEGQVEVALEIEFILAPDRPGYMVCGLCGTIWYWYALAHDDYESLPPTSDRVYRDDGAVLVYLMTDISNPELLEFFAKLHERKMKRRRETIEAWREQQKSIQKEALRTQIVADVEAQRIRRFVFGDLQTPPPSDEE